MKPRRENLKDFVRESYLFRVRVMVAFVALVLVMLGIAGRFFHLQVLQHESFTTRSEANRVKLRAIPPTRGLIYDRNGLLVAVNRPAYRLEIVPEQLRDLDDTLRRLGGVVALEEADIRTFMQMRRLRREFHGIPLRFNLDEREVARFAVNRHEFPGVDVVPHLSRHYPLGEHLAHVVGYVGRIDADELRTLDPTRYSATSHVGKTGVELAYEDVLHGEVGLERIEVNAQGRVLRVLEREDPVPGFHLHLNLDASLQIAAESAFEGYAGAVVALKPGTGEVLAMVSVPAFNPNLFVEGIDRATYAELNSSPRTPLFNRSLAGTYPPGSAIKPFMALAGLELGFRDADDTTFCPGYFRLPGEDRRYRDWQRRGHGHVDVNRAIVESCDVYFYKLAVDLGIDRIHDYLQPFGFGEFTGIDIGPERVGVLPSREWKRSNRGMPWFPGETVITGIGQGFTLATPMQLAVATATLATRGIRPQPQVVGAVEVPSDESREMLVTEPAARLPVRQPAHWDRTIHAMEDVVHGPRGTARRIASREYRIAGKTGTSQVFGLPQDVELDAEELALHLQDHALFVAFAPAQAAEIAVAVVVEHGGSGGRVAAPVARAVMDAYMGRIGFAGAGGQP